MKHSRYRYFSELKRAKDFINGSLRFCCLSHYHRIEDGEVRGDLNEGSIIYTPDGGLTINDQTQGKSFRIPEGAFVSGVNTEEVFILCASASMTDELRVKFEAKACVEIRKVATFCARIQAELPPNATFRAHRVTYYSPAAEPGVKWAFPDMIAFSKVDSYAWQDEYRFAFSLSGALQDGKTTQRVNIHGPIHGTDPTLAVTVPRPYGLSIGDLSDICELHEF